MISATVQTVLRNVSASVSGNTVTATVQAAVPVSISAVIHQGVAGPPGAGDMESLIYDPGGKKTNVFDAGNLIGNIDGGTFN